MERYKELKSGDPFVFPGLEKQFTVVGYIPGGFNRIILKANCNGGTGTRILKIAQAHEGDADADQFKGKCGQIHDYQQSLQRLGVLTPSPITTHENVIDGKRFLLETSPFTGQSVHEMMLTAPRNDVLELCQQMIDVALKPIFSQNLRADGNLPCGVDMIPRNFTKDPGVMHYVDLWPPKLWLDGEPTLEYPEPMDTKVIQLGIFRHFTIKGVAQAFLVQLCRIRPELRREFQRLVDGALKGMGLHEELGWLQQQPARQFQNGGDLKQIIEPLGYEQIYGLREIACELAFQGQISAGQLERIFKDSHFQDTPLPSATILQIKEVLFH
ncbi:MAG: hypothetical protein COY66_02305 [Candidatus Kerfeldbacteria bacterium CG_4_10_14_0_8_um_filter_42_10]|uniref:Protein kinase domain-containing protein n=1 Tax=Candidatus Kerfeldbacteria bacterium CG_4_10_14_0_8_um_filter_42_10 TaxID=2014248 RepID=A0A2M7RJB1_9BACT|nr:MAG: hypothetical protein COY66_02305 [Candidatus Kerfeldbacteria bacterium CG_4_10_14_0_8_um_filter_42_10]